MKNSSPIARSLARSLIPRLRFSLNARLPAPLRASFFDCVSFSAPVTTLHIYACTYTHIYTHVHMYLHSSRASGERELLRKPPTTPRTGRINYPLFPARPLHVGKDRASRFMTREENRLLFICAHARSAISQSIGERDRFLRARVSACRG